MQLEYLSLPFHLSDADFTGELRHGQAASLQAEGAVQGSLTAAPNVVEWDLLSHKEKWGSEKLDQKGKVSLSCMSSTISDNLEHSFHSRSAHYFFSFFFALGVSGNWVSVCQSTIYFESALSINYNHYQIARLFIQTAISILPPREYSTQSFSVNNSTDFYKVYWLYSLRK